MDGEGWPSRLPFPALFELSMLPDGGVLRGGGGARRTVIRSIWRRTSSSVLGPVADRAGRNFRYAAGEEGGPS